MATRRVFDEDKTRPGVQGMPAPNSSRRRPVGDQGAYALQQYVDAQAALLRAEQDAEMQRQRGSNMAAYMANRRVRQQTQAVEQQRKALTPAKPVASQPAKPTVAADPVVSVPGTTTTTTTDSAMPAAPVAVTDPASEISPEEQAARLRARILLMSGGQRGKLAGTMGSQLGYRSLLGL